MIAHICLAVLLLAAQATGRCGQCGMDLSKHQKTQYEILWQDGTKIKTCGVQCGLTQHILHKDNYRSSVAKDYLTGSSFDAQTGFYVFESSVVPDMAPGFIAFSKRADAEKFQAEFGGKVVTYTEALSLWTERKVHR